MKEYQHIAVYSLGDNAGSQWTELMKELEDGYSIVSAASDKNAIHYILVREEQER